MEEEEEEFITTEGLKRESCCMSFKFKMHLSSPFMMMMRVQENMFLAKSLLPGEEEEEDPWRSEYITQ
jgi:hypothetical protein